MLRASVGKARRLSETGTPVSQITHAMSNLKPRGRVNPHVEVMAPLAEGS